MNRIRFLRSTALALTLLVVTQAPPALAQFQGATVQPINPDADRLAEQMRALADNPRDLQALLAAGDLSVRLNDSSAALAFFARAEAIEPGNPRILAGRGAALVRMERPGEALRLFQAAEAAGLAPVNYAGDRGFAYDLLGAPQLAQRDYQLALQRGSDDEIVRRFALSLGITNKPEEAMAELDILLRKGDRAAWRDRAFILAMNGDQAGAERIAASMMPGTMGAGLVPFFRRLENLSVSDRAYAVNFGELSPTSARLADLRLAPPVPAYVPEPKAVAVVAPPPTPAPPAAPAKGRGRRSRHDEELAAMTAAAKPQPVVQVAEANPLPPPPAFVPPSPEPIIQPLPTPVPTPRPARPAPSRPAPVLLADNAPAPAPRPAPRPPAPARIGEEDSVLAAIVKGITIPPSELESVAAPKPDPKPVRVAAAEPKPVKPVAKPEKPDPKAGAKGKLPAKPDPKKPEPKKPDPKKLEPSRIWVQVAGGANEDTLPSTWKKLVKQAPTAFKGKSAWSTPLRATNRLLAGPFKSEDEAQSFVNLLHKADMSGFVFTSEAGQKITKLAVK